MNRYPDSERVAGIDTLRVFAVFAVILIHIHPFRHFDAPYGRLAQLIATQGARWGVPFFFIIAGYFFGRKTGTAGTLRSPFFTYAGRVLLLFLFWCIVFAVIPSTRSEIARIAQYGYLRHTYWKLYGLVLEPTRLLLEGTKGHLWFLVSLVTGLAVVAATACIGRRWVIPVAASLYIAGLLGGSYAATPLGFELGIDTRDGPFHSSLFLALGWWLSTTRFRTSPVTAVALILTGLCIHMSEVLFLWSRFGVHPLTHNFLAGTVLYGTGFALLALSLPELGRNRSISHWGRLTMGVYAIHPFFIGIVKGAGDVLQSVLWELTGPILVCALSLIAAAALSRWRVLRPFVV